MHPAAQISALFNYCCFIFLPKQVVLFPNHLAEPVLSFLFSISVSLQISHCFSSKAWECDAHSLSGFYPFYEKNTWDLLRPPASSLLLVTGICCSRCSRASFAPAAGSGLLGFRWFLCGIYWTFVEIITSGSLSASQLMTRSFFPLLEKMKRVFEWHFFKLGKF